jgi:dihydrodipicolinate synthase/N-acetylneuraminate lyase
MLEISEHRDFERAQAMWSKAIELSNFIYSGGFARMTALGKEMARLAGRPMGSYERLPLERPSQEDREKLRALMKRAGMAEGANR